MPFPVVSFSAAMRPFRLPIRGKLGNPARALQKSIAFTPRHWLITNQTRNATTDTTTEATPEVDQHVKTTHMTLNMLGLDRPELPIKGRKKKSETPVKEKLYESVRRIYDENPGVVVLFRVGDFFELYFEQAENYAKLLDLSVVDKKMAGGEFCKFAGFPIRLLDKNVGILIEKNGFSVAIVEQFGNVAEGIVRKVTRIITPGTLIDEQYVNTSENNYLLAIAGEADAAYMGFSWCDLSTGTLLTERVEKDQIEATLSRIRPREVLIDENLAENTNHPFIKALTNSKGRCKIAVTTRNSNLFDLVSAPNRLQECTNMITWTAPEQHKSIGHNSEMKNMFSEMSDMEICSSAALLSYVLQTQLDHKPRFHWPNRHDITRRLSIDNATLQSLELVTSIRGNTQVGSLLHAINLTKTHQGSRLFQRRLVMPLTSLMEINTRLSIVEFFHRDSHPLEASRIILGEMRDATRCLQRINMQLHKPDDFLCLAATLELVRGLKTVLIEGCTQRKRPPPAAVDDLIGRLDVHADLVRFICDMIIFEKGEVSPSEDAFFVRTVKPEASPQLTALYEILNRLEEEKNLLEKRLAEKHKGAQLSITNGEPYVQISGSNKTIEEPGVLLMRSLTSKTRFRVPEWTKLAFKLQAVAEKIQMEEKEILAKLRDTVILNTPTISSTLQAVAEIDVASSLAALAIERGYVKPEMNLSQTQIIQGGRHPVVELHLASRGGKFTQNNTHLGGDQRFWLLTGPNMGGKSTFLRQNALICILAQMGSYVPAKSATLGIVDSVFSRVGGSDNLAQDQSTFMVEMQETALILRNATPKSLVIMDEVGRGTSTLDGLAIAYATMDHLYRKNVSRVLFATHFHELSRMMESKQHDDGFPNAKFYRMKVWKSDKGNEFALTHEIEPGVSKQSFGLHAAQLAGLPPSVLNNARRIQTKLQQLADQGRSFVENGV